MEEKITSTAAQTFRNLKRMRAVVEAVRELASEVDAEGTDNAPAEELPQVISEGIVSRIAALEKDLEDIRTFADNAYTLADAANNTANYIRSNIDTPLTIRGQMTSRTVPQSGAMYKFDGSASKILPLEVDKTTALFTATVPSRPKSCFQMFKDNRNIFRIDTMPDLSQCTSLYMTFCGCDKLTHVNTSEWHTSACTSMVYLFQACKALVALDVSGLDTSKVTDMGGAFNSMVALRRLDLSTWDVSKCKMFEHMFFCDAALEELDVSTWNLASATSIKGMFHNCKKLKNLDVSRWSTPSLTNVWAAFYMMDSLEELDLTGWDVSKVTNFRAMVAECYALHTLHLGVFDMGSADVDEESGTRQMFWASSSLANITGEVRNLARGLDLRHCPLTNESAMVFINGLVDIDRSETITFSPTTYDTLTEEQIALATSKGFTVVKSS